MSFVLLLSVFVIATCGIVYELLASTLASYLLGDSVTQFSTIIGVYLFAMGIGSFLSRYFTRNLIAVFIQVEILLGVVGGCSAALLFSLFEVVASFQVLLYGMVTLTGMLVGLEIPLLMRILKGHLEFKDLVSKVFSFDSVGALLASLLFPLVLAPHLGLIRTGFMFGILNVAVALWTLHLFKEDVPWIRVLRGTAILVLAGLGLGFVYSDKLMSLAEAATYPDTVIYSKASPYQRIVLTNSPHDMRLFLNGNLQFSSRDEYRYHEALVHVGLHSVPNPRNVLVLGGGDGMAVREILKHPSVESVTLVDLDGMMTELFVSNPALVALNEAALRSPKVQVVNTDAFRWLKENQRVFDFVAVDFPDPSNYSIGKLYSTSFYKLLYRAVSPDGLAVIQSTSPYVARKSFWCIDQTIQAVGFQTKPYHCLVPSFGEWGFVLASKQPFKVADDFLPGLKFVTRETADQMFQFPPDMQRVATDVNKLNNQILVRYFEEEWSAYLH
ncbi:Spermidine synthase [compost metagenome]